MTALKFPVEATLQLMPVEAMNLLLYVQMTVQVLPAEGVSAILVMHAHLAPQGLRAESGCQAQLL